MSNKGIGVHMSLKEFRTDVKLPQQHTAQNIIMMMVVNLWRSKSARISHRHPTESDYMVSHFQ